MEGKFEFKENMALTDEMIKAKAPFITVAVSLTGDNNSGYSKHTPLRIVASAYEYDDSYGGYALSESYDKVIACSKEALDIATNSATKYKAFAEAGVDKKAYLNGENVVNLDDAIKEFDTLLEKYNDKDAVIVTNLKQHTVDSLALSNSKMIDAYKDRRIIDMGDFFAEYYGKKKSLGFAKEYFANPDVDTETLKSAKLVGTDKRCDAMKDIIITYSRNRDMLIDKITMERNKADIAAKEEYSRRGKEAYANAPLEAKLDFLQKNLKINAENLLDRNADVDINKLYDIFDKKEGNIGFTILAVGTTGFGAENLPIQVALLACKLKDGGAIDVVGNKVFNVRADKRCVEKAIAEAQRGGYNVFTRAGINIDDYRNGIGVVSEDETTTIIDEFISDFPLEDYPVITNGKSKDGTYSFAGEALSKITNVPIINAPFVDFTQVTKEYFCKYFIDENIKENVLCPIESWGNRGFSLDELADANDMGKIDSGYKKVATIAFFCSRLGSQYLALRDKGLVKKSDYVKPEPEEVQTEEVKETPVPEVKEEIKPEPVVQASEIKPESHPASHIEEGDYMNFLASQSFELADEVVLPDDTGELDNVTMIPAPTYRTDIQATPIDEKEVAKEKAEEVKAEVKEEKPAEPVTETKEPVKEVSKAEIKKESKTETEVKAEVKKETKEEVKDIPKEEVKTPVKASEKPVETAAVPIADNNTTDLVNALVSAVKEQTEVMRSQSDALAMQNRLLITQTNALIDIVTKQSVLLERMIEKSAPEMQLDYTDKSAVSEYIETLRDSMKELSDNVPLIQKNIQAADMSLMAGIKNLALEEDKKRQEI